MAIFRSKIRADRAVMRSRAKLTCKHPSLVSATFQRPRYLMVTTGPKDTTLLPQREQITDSIKGKVPPVAANTCPLHRVAIAWMEAGTTKIRRAGARHILLGITRAPSSRGMTGYRQMAIQLPLWEQLRIITTSSPIQKINHLRDANIGTLKSVSKISLASRIFFSIYFCSWGW